MPSDDDTCSLGVESIASDDESDVEWETSTGPEDLYEYEPRQFRMPSPHTSFTLGPVAAQPGSFTEIKFPSPYDHSAADTVVFIIFAPLVVAKSLCSALRDPNRSAISCGFYDGTKVRFLDGDIPAINTPRVALLYFSTSDSYDPVPEYKQYSRETSQIPCTPITSDYIDPLSMVTTGVCFTDKRCLLSVTSTTGKSSHIPVPVSLLPSIDILALIPGSQGYSTSSRREMRNIFLLSWLQSTQTFKLLIPSIIGLLLLSLGIYDTFFMPRTAVGFQTANHDNVIDFTTGTKNFPHFQSRPSLFTTADKVDMTTSGSISDHPMTASNWLDVYNILNAVADFTHGVLVNSIQSIQAFIANTLLLIETVIREVNYAVSTTIKSTKAVTSASLRSTRIRTRQFMKGYTEEVSFRYQSVVSELRGSTTRWLNHARHYYSQIPARKLQFFRKVSAIRDHISSSKTQGHVPSL